MSYKQSRAAYDGLVGILPKADYARIIREDAPKFGFVRPGSLESHAQTAMSTEGTDRTLINIMLRGQPYTAAVSNRLLWNGRSLTQSEHIAKYGPSTFTLIPSDGYFSLFKALIDGTHGNEEKVAKRLLDKIRKNIPEIALLTGTEATYATEKGKDAVTHDVGTKSPRIMGDLSLVGPDGALANLDDQDSITDIYAGLKADDTEALIRDVLPGRQGWHWRINRQPTGDPQKRPVVLGLDDVNIRFDIYASNGNNNWPARGWLVAPRKTA